MLWLLSGPLGFTCWFYFAPVFSFMYCWVLIFALSLFLYLDLYFLGDYAWISYGSFMQTKHLCVLIHHWTKGGVGAPWNRFKPSSKMFLLTVSMQCFFCGSFMLFMSCVCYAFTSVHCCLVVERADLLALVCDVYCDLLLSHLVSWDKRGSWLHRSMILAVFLTLKGT